MKFGIVCDVESKMFMGTGAVRFHAEGVCLGPNLPDCRRDVHVPSRLQNNAHEVPEEIPFKWVPLRRLSAKLPFCKQLIEDISAVESPPNHQWSAGLESRPD